MINWFNNRNNIVKYLICVFLILVLFVLLRLILNSYYLTPIKSHNNIEKRLISSEGNNYKIMVYYPKFHIDKMDKIISNYLYDYINDFKKESESKEELNVLTINYELSFIEGYLSIDFSINNTINTKSKNKNFLINLKNYKLANITDIYDKDLISDKINSKVKEKYSSYIYNEVKKLDVTSLNYNIKSDLVNVYFDNYEFNDITYTPVISFSLVNNENNEKYEIDTSKKLIALTFDDGPSIYTLDFIKLLELNNSKATFFMIGKRMKSKKDIVKEVYKSGNEIGSHSYSHKDLTGISSEEVLEEINSVAILYNQITNDNLKYLRPPYGKVNSLVESLSNYPLIEWSIDSKDWLYKDPERVANNIINIVSDGDIILMHDVYPESLETAKILIPELKERGFELVTISELAKYKNYKFIDGKVTKKIK